MCSVIVIITSHFKDYKLRSCPVLNSILSIRAGGSEGTSVESWQWFGLSFGAGLYFSGSTGVAFDIPDRSTYKITSTTCRGLKFDISIGGRISVTYLPKMSDLLGDAITVELGMDIPGTEFGVDVLVHFNEAEKRFIGFGLSFGMGIGLSPIDIATSRCNTRQVAEYQSSVKIPIGYAGPYLKCNRTFIGVVSDDRYILLSSKITQPAAVPKMCWFDGTECPFTPAQEYDKGTTQSKKMLLVIQAV